MLADAIAAGGSSLRDYRRADGELGYFQHAFAVYGRAGAPCLRPGCAGTVARAVPGGPLELPLPDLPTPRLTATDDFREPRAVGLHPTE